MKSSIHCYRSHEDLTVEWLVNLRAQENPSFSTHTVSKTKTFPNKESACTSSKTEDFGRTTPQMPKTRTTPHREAGKPPTSHQRQAHRPPHIKTERQASRPPLLRGRQAAHLSSESRGRQAAHLSQQRQAGQNQTESA